MKYGLIGEHLKHSFSVDIHHLIDNYSYELKELNLDEFDVFMKNRDFKGINVTIPYKEKVIPYLDVVDKAAARIGAVNTVINVDNKLIGYNTDYYGLKSLILKMPNFDCHYQYLILGTGGTSNTAEVVLEDLGCKKILKVSRNSKNGVITYNDLKDFQNEDVAVINTTPVGMFPNNYNAIDLSSLEHIKFVVDVIFNPLNTSLVVDAKKRNIPATGGLYMLVAQAVYAAKYFMNKDYSLSIIDKIYDKIYHEKRNIVLIGMPSCGKTTIGKKLSIDIGRTFIDTDELIKDKIGMEINQYFSLNGEASFRKCEHEIILEIAKNSSSVIATGGGVILNEDNMKALAQNGYVIFLNRDLKYLVPTTSRPLSSSKEALEKRYNERLPLYKKYCDIEIDVEDDMKEAVNKIKEVI